MANRRAKRGRARTILLRKVGLDRQFMPERDRAKMSPIGPLPTDRARAPALAADTHAPRTEAIESSMVSAGERA